MAHKMLGLESSRAMKADCSVFPSFCVLTLPRHPDKGSSPAATCVPGLDQGVETGAGKKVSVQKNKTQTQSGLF